MKKEDLLNLINDDDLGLLSIKPKNTSANTEDERLIASFLEINNFIQENKREPQTGNGLQEHQLASRLKSLRENKKKSKILLDFDEFELLNVESKEIKSVTDIFEDDDLGILSSLDENLFQLNNVPNNKERERADYIAHRKPCKDFEQFESKFQECQSDLSSGRRKLIKFQSDRQIKENSFLVLNGVLLFIDKIGKTHVDKYGKIDGRQRCIFENGTESEMLFRSLVKRLYENGHAISETVESDEEALMKNFGVIADEDKKTGFIYIAKSLSSDPRIRSLENLYKIGFSATPIDERIKNASQDPTFLMASVKVITTFECFNLNPQKLEQLLHKFFGQACLNVDIFDANKKRYSPREWFIVPLKIIEKTIELMINGGILNYKYDSGKQEITLR